MKRVVNFYSKLPRGAAPEQKATGILGRYQAKHFGKNPTAKRTFAWPLTLSLRQDCTTDILSQLSFMPLPSFSLSATLRTTTSTSVSPLDTNVAQTHTLFSNVLC